MVFFFPRLPSLSAGCIISSSQAMLRHRSCNFYSSAKKKDPYDVLGIPKSASAAAIKKAYLGLVKQFHPDTNKDPAAKEKFVEVQTAYDILSDDQKRASFDANGYQENEDSQHPDPADIFKSFFGAGRSSRPGSGSAFDPFADLFGTHAFRGTSRGGKRISEDIQMRITLTFLEAALGCVKPITLSRWEQCGTCSGSGITPGTTMATCKGCGGRGAKVFSRGGMVIEVPCDTCDGTGSHNPNPCKKCSGDGIHRSASPTPIEVRIPAGVDSSTQLVMEGMGNSMGTGSRAGNLLLQFKVQESPIFRRDGNDIYQSTKVPLMTSLLGGSIRIPSLSGEVDLLISPCSIQPGDVKRLKGKGIFNESMRKQGDMFVTLGVELPATLSAHQKSILRDWDGSAPSSASTAQPCGSSPSSAASKLKDWIREKVATSEKVEGEKHH